MYGHWVLVLVNFVVKSIPVSSFAMRQSPLWKAAMVCISRSVHQGPRAILGPAFLESPCEVVPFVSVVDEKDDQSLSVWNSCTLDTRQTISVIDSMRGIKNINAAFHYHSSF